MFNFIFANLIAFQSQIEFSNLINIAILLLKLECDQCTLA